ncbi:MAG: 50S ribosomal protein L25 [Candidatus Sungbacteria bacterium]|nr:50S ribosomal protein L25 [Candidatus Sungbacteria bacterium]
MQELKASSRTELGRRVKPLRKDGFLPGVVYGEGVASRPVSVPYKDFDKVYREAGESTIIELDVDGKQYNVLIQDIARDPMRGDMLHADFYAVRMDKVIRTKVRVAFVGESPAVKNDGGVLVKVMQEIEVEALPKDLTREIRVDVSKLVVLESRITVKDIVLPQGVKALAAPDDVLVLVEKPRAEEELAALKQAPLAEPVAEVKTEQEAKREAKEKDKDEATEEKGTGKEAGAKV